MLVPTKQTRVRDREQATPCAITGTVRVGHRGRPAKLTSGGGDVVADVQGDRYPLAGLSVSGASRSVARRIIRVAASCPPQTPRRRGSSRPSRPCMTGRTRRRIGCRGRGSASVPRESRRRSQRGEQAGDDAQEDRGADPNSRDQREREQRPPIAPRLSIARSNP